MLAARLIVGVGEAAYGSVGLAVLLTVFPARMRATITGTFLAGGMIGSVLGISLGGFIAAHFGWRAAFAGMAVFGIVLTICYPLVVKEGRVAAGGDERGRALPTPAAAHAGVEPFGHLRLPRQWRAAVHQRCAARVAA